jgi:aminoglycoside phosphotransferase (APT) family kinase protein
VGNVSHLGLVLIEGIPGRPEIAPLIKAVAGGGHEQHAQALARAVDVSAQVAAGVHSTLGRPSRARSFEQDALGLKEEIEALGRVLPEAVDRLAELLSQVVTEAAGPEPALEFCHGDFTPSQILFDGTDVGLIDFDNLCRAEPALDLGQFCAYMTAAALKAQPSDRATNELGSQLRQRFLEAYGGTAIIADVDELGERVRAYERLSLLRMTVRARRQLKTARALLALEAFETTGGTNEKVKEAETRRPWR